jgi:uncharacterized protein GlcG (DUF336 family)
MISLDDARRVITAAESKAREIGQPMNIAVVAPRKTREGEGMIV